MFNQIIRIRVTVKKLLNKSKLFLQRSLFLRASVSSLLNKASMVKQCISIVKTRVVFSTNEILSAINKHVLPSLQKSNVIYQFLCHCRSSAVATRRGQGGRAHPNNCMCPSFRFTHNTFLEHHIATNNRQYWEKEIITFKHNILV